MKKPEIVIFCCYNCTSSEDVDSIERHEAADIRLIKLPCSGRLEVLHILEAFETGSDGVIVLTCLDGKCQSLVGNKRAKNRLELAKKYLDEIGLGQGRLLMKQTFSSASEDKQPLTEAVDEMIGRVGEMGQNPLQ
ncbi:hydrogenase iron-sulfur subunit [bacterium]|nr:hydrogenase iron-sulfur subunit [bacterium]MBU1754003.1 hydrogenase iron-sulfur subunit [bacterium]